MSDDITFCLNQHCPHEKCMRRSENAPKTHPFSAAMFLRAPDGSCQYRFDVDWDTVEDTSPEGSEDV